MDPDLREVKLPYAPDATSMEYAVHGRFLKPPVDGIELTSGVWGCFYMSLGQMVRDMNKEKVNTLMLQFEHDLKEARTARPQGGTHGLDQRARGRGGG